MVVLAFKSRNVEPVEYLIVHHAAWHLGSGVVDSLDLMMAYTSRHLGCCVALRWPIARIIRGFFVGTSLGELGWESTNEKFNSAGVIERNRAYQAKSSKSAMKSSTRPSFMCSFFGLIFASCGPR